MSATFDRTEILKENGDTYYNMSVEDFIKAVLDAEFQQVLKQDFNHSENGSERTDSYYVFAHPDGWVIAMDTYTSAYSDPESTEPEENPLPTVNTAELYYNILFGDLRSASAAMESGSIADYQRHPNSPVRSLVHGYHDCRENLLGIMTRLTTNGRLMRQWKHNPITWLASRLSTESQVDHAFTVHDKGKSRFATSVHMRKLSEDNYAQLPHWVKMLMGAEEESAVGEFEASTIKGQDLRKPGVYDRFVAECKKQGLPIPPVQYIEHGHHHWLQRKPSAFDNTFSEMVAQWAPGELKWYRSNEIATSAQPLDLKGWEYVAHIAPPALS